MTREEHLKFCTACKNKKLNLKQGLICNLTDKIADFEGSCPSYDEDVQVKSTLAKQKATLQTVSLGKRFTNYIVDLLCCFVVIFLYAIAFGILIGIFIPEQLDSLMGDNSFFSYLLSMLGISTYYILFEYSTGRSAGKYLTGTKVVDLYGQEPGFGTIVKRTFCRFIPFEAFSFLGSDAMGWHDTISDTRVVDADFEPEPIAPKEYVATHKREVE